MVTVKMQVQRSGEERDRTEHEAEYETTEKEIRECHRSSFGPRASKSRSARPGFSRIRPRSVRQRRESGWRASFSNAAHTAGSLRKRSAPPISQRSNLSSSAPTSDISSVE